ncbi:hypothetical protein pb186bvf_018173 [Paramecium bursaria]
MRTLKRPQSPEAIIYEPSGHKRPSSNECQLLVPGSQYFVDMDNVTITNRVSRPISALSSYRKNVSAVEKQQQSEIKLNDTRTTPRYIRKDKEELYQEILINQQQRNGLIDENTKLKTQIAQQQREISKLTELVQNVELFMHKKTSNVNVYNMKSQNKELQKKISELENELKQVKYNQKASKTEEMRIELKETHQENIRLRTQLDYQIRQLAMLEFNDMNQIEEKLYIQGQMLNSLKSENDQLSGLMKIQEDEANYYRELLGEALKKVRAYELSIDDLHKSLKGKNQFMDKLAQKIELLKGSNFSLSEKVIRVEDLNQEIKELKIKQQELLKALQDQNQNNEYLTGLVHELKQKNAEKTIFEQREKKMFEDQIAKMSVQYDLLDDKYKNLLTIQQQAKFNKETIASSVYKIQQTTIPQNLGMVKQDNFLQQVYVPKKLRTVRIQDVRDTGIELNYRFRLKKISLSDVIEQYLFDDDNKKRGQVQLKQLSQRFQQEPFLLVDQDKALLFARYLVEDNSRDFVDFNIDQVDTLVRVQSVFTKIVGNYRIFLIDEERKLKEEIQPIITKYKSSLKQHFDSLLGVNGELSKQQILDTFTFMDIDLKQDQMEYFFLRLFAISNNIDRFPYGKIFEIFQQPNISQTKVFHRRQLEKDRRRNKLKGRAYLDRLNIIDLFYNNIYEQNVLFRVWQLVYIIKDSYVKDPWVCVWNAVSFCELCALNLYTDLVLNIKKFKHISQEEKEKFKRGGNQSFIKYCGKDDNKFHSIEAHNYRLQLSLGLQYESETDDQSQDSIDLKVSTYEKSLIQQFIKNQGLQTDIQWIKLQYQILNTDIRDKVNNRYYYGLMLKMAKEITNNVKIIKKDISQQGVIDSFKSLI